MIERDDLAYDAMRLAVDLHVAKNSDAEILIVIADAEEIYIWLKEKNDNAR